MAKVNQIYLLLIFSICFLCTLELKAQYDEDNDRLFYGGAVVGSNFCQVDGDNFAGYHKVGLQLGAILFLKISKPTAISMELLYTEKGSRAGINQLPRLMNDQSGVLVDYKIFLKYAEVPLLINYIDKNKNNLGLGLSFAYLGSSKELYTDGNGAVYESDAKWFPFKKYEIAGVANACAHVWKGLAVGLRMQYSLTNIRNQNNYLTGRTLQYNNLVSLRMLYVF
ncbi:MAG: hypothetical protein IT215_00015 [Chitinophagaceae bacterium]|nr:hypothetical protein [Chitinophagaceae bacterium]HMN31757.1 hypothetical protein [Chitinophagaceae bacterium]